MSRVMCGRWYGPFSIVERFSIVVVVVVHANCCDCMQGCILYELATRKHPFQASNLPSLIRKILTGSVEAIPSEYSPGVCASVAQNRFVVHCWRNAAASVLSI